MGYSLAGLVSAYRKEDSVKLEILSLILLIVILAFVPWPLWKKAAMTAAFLLIPLAELVNSAIEDVCDLVSPGFDPKVKDAKDKGSAAVLITIVLNVAVLAALCLFPG
jgi:diacylglycerol kinase (ATP)